MSSEERKKILQMVADGKINAEEAATLMHALAESAEEEIVPVGEASGMGGERSDAPEFDQVRRRANRFSNAFLWIGVIFTVLSAWAMLGIQQNAGTNFWFYCMGMPLFLGILFTTIGAGSRTSRWMYVNVDRSHQAEWPRNITIALPLPLGLASWFLENFGSRIRGLKETSVDEIIKAIAMAKNITEPLIVHVDDDDGERVQVFIG
ncbi:MAG: hypothetical protein IPO22_03290 [Anaerolineales bacterium]|jgi:hypothetical protein|nr:hypothetical protein [Anaerolineales bacterium]